MGSEHVTLDFMIFEVKKLDLITSPSMEPCTEAVKAFDMSSLEKVTVKLSANREERQNL